MNLDQLQTGFFGYKKFSVYEYITMMEEEFSTKLSEKDAAYKKKEDQYRARIDQLEEELHRVKEELAQQQMKQPAIMSAQTEFTPYEEALRQEAYAKVQKEREAWEQELAASIRELNQYHTQIANIREIFCNLLHTMEKQSQTLEQQVETIQSMCPHHNMTLFKRNHSTQV